MGLSQLIRARSSPPDQTPSEAPGLVQALPRGFPAVLVEYVRSYNPATGGYTNRHAPDGVDYASVEVEVGLLWHALTLLLRPRRVLETGTYRGFSTCCLAHALKAAHADDPRTSVVTIDPEPRDHLWIDTPLADIIRYIPKTSQDAAPEFAARLRVVRDNARGSDGGPALFDLLVLDSDHHYDTIISELSLFEPMLEVGGHILLHDSLYYDGVGRAVEQLRASARFETLTLDSPRTHGVPGCRPPGVTLVRKARDGEPLAADPRFRGLHVGERLQAALLREAR